MEKINYLERRREAMERRRELGLPEPEPLPNLEPLLMKLEPVKLGFVRMLPDMVEIPEEIIGFRGAFMESSQPGREYSLTPETPPAVPPKAS